jgi:predicted lipoprotein with Yx(FWY)xxD motif
MTSRIRSIALALVLGMLLVACGGDDASDTTQAAEAPVTTEAATTDTTAATTDTTAAPSAEMTTLTVASTDLGDVLVDGEGYTVYVFAMDEQNSGTSACEGDCLANWPAVGEVEAGEGVDASLIGTIERPEGSTQATYNGWPLYYFINDAAPGDTTGQGVNDVWYVVGPDGSAVGMEG